jgi:hypothetical protein
VSVIVVVVVVVVVTDKCGVEHSCRDITHYCSNLFTVNDIGGYS